MSDLFNRVIAGQPIGDIRAPTWNAMLAAAQAHQRNPRGPDNRIVGPNTDSGMILVRNDTGDDLDRFSVVGLDVPVILPDDNLPQFKSNIAFAGISPTADHVGGKFAILAAPLNDGKIGPAFALSVCPVRLVGEPGDNADVDTEAGSGGDPTAALRVQEGGSAIVLWDENTSGDTERWGIVKLAGGGSTGRTFPAKITGGGGGNNDYDWTKMVPDGAGELQVADPAVTGTATAHEVNDRHGIPADTIVQLHFNETISGVDHYIFDKDQGEKGTADTSLDEGTAEHADAADSNTWDRTSQSTNRGLTLSVCTGMRYDHNAATPELLAYMRTLTFDADGHLTDVSAESRVVIDSTGTC